MPLYRPYARTYSVAIGDVGDGETSECVAYADGVLDASVRGSGGLTAVAAAGFASAVAEIVGADFACGAAVAFGFQVCGPGVLLIFACCPSAEALSGFDKLHAGIVKAMRVVCQAEAVHRVAHRRKITTSTHIQDQEPDSPRNAVCRAPPPGVYELRRPEPAQFRPPSAEAT